MVKENMAKNMVKKSVSKIMGTKRIIPFAGKKYNTLLSDNVNYLSRSPRVKRRVTGLIFLLEFMWAKRIILILAMLVSANLFCDISIYNQTGATVRTVVEGAFGQIQDGDMIRFAVSPDAKVISFPLGNINVAAGNTIIIWANEESLKKDQAKAAWYKTAEIIKPESITLRPNGEYGTCTWTKKNHVLGMPIAATEKSPGLKAQKFFMPLVKKPVKK